MLRGSEYTRFLNMPGFWIYQGHEHASGYARVLNKLEFWISRGSEYIKVLNTRLILNMPWFWIRFWFWICQGSEYASGSEFARVLNMSELHRVLNMSDYVWLNMPGYVWICRNMREYAKICLNDFSFIFPHCNPLSTWRRGYLFQRFHKTKSLVWMKARLFYESIWGNMRQFDLIAVSISFDFYFILNVLKSKISNLLLPLGIDGGGACESRNTLL